MYNQTGCKGGSYVYPSSCINLISSNGNSSAMFVSSLPAGQYIFFGNYASNDSTCIGSILPLAGAPYPFLGAYVLMNTCIPNGGNNTFTYTQANSSFTVQENGINCVTNPNMNIYSSLGCFNYSDYNNATISGYFSAAIVTLTSTTTGSASSSGATGNNPSSSSANTLLSSPFLFFIFIWSHLLTLNFDGWLFTKKRTNEMK